MILLGFRTFTIGGEVGLGAGLLVVGSSYEKRIVLGCSRLMEIKRLF